MNNKDTNNYKCKKNKRKVILLRYKDRTERIVLIKTVRKRKETLKIKIQSNVNKKHKTVSQNEKYPIFRAQLKDRIVPRCLRDKCRRDIHRKSEQCRRQRHRMARNKSNNDKKKKEVPPPIIILSDEDSDALHYDDISSGSLSDYTDDEIETLMKSTRKRMRDLDEEWKLMPRQINSTCKKSIDNKCLSKSPSVNSLDTLVLDAEEEEGLATPKLSEAIYSPITSPENIIKFEPMETNNNLVKFRPTNELRESLQYNEDIQKKEEEQINHLLKSKTTAEKKIKLEPMETNDIMFKNTSINESNYNDYIQKDKKGQILNKVNFKVMSPEKTIKLEPLETVAKNRLKYESKQNQDTNFQNNEKIEAVIMKLERNDMDCTELDHNNIDIKQELYGDIQ